MSRMNGKKTHTHMKVLFWTRLQKLNPVFHINHISRNDSLFYPSVCCDTVAGYHHSLSVASLHFHSFKCGIIDDRRRSQVCCRLRMSLALQASLKSGTGYSSSSSRLQRRDESNFYSSTSCLVVRYQSHNRVYVTLISCSAYCLAHPC